MSGKLEVFCQEITRNLDHLETAPDVNLLTPQQILNAVRGAIVEAAITAKIVGFQADGEVNG
jgi:hypothetical protein